jgi:hypothetical protein
VQDRTPETVEAGDLQRVAFAQDAQDDIELWAAGLRAAGVVDVDVSLRHASAVERVDLVVGVLVSGGDPRVAEQHGVENTALARVSVVVFRRGFSTSFDQEIRPDGWASANDRLPTPTP